MRTDIRLIHFPLTHACLPMLPPCQVNDVYLEYLLALDSKLRYVREDDIARTSQVWVWVGVCGCGCLHVRTCQ